MNTLLRVTSCLFVALSMGAAGASEGDLDLRFGMQGYALSNIANLDSAVVSAPLAQADGKILICETLVPVTSGYIRGFDANFVVSRFMPDGTLDPTFGADGHAVIDFDHGNDVCNDLALDGNGRIVAVGTSRLAPAPGATSSLFAIARLNADGSPDATFGDGAGKTLLHFNADSNEFAHASRVQLQDDGKLLIAGDVAGTGSIERLFAIARLDRDGRPDPFFATQGKLQLHLDTSGQPSVATLLTIALTADDRILLVGQDLGGFLLARIEHDGRADDSFGDHGHVAIAFDQADYSFFRAPELAAMAIQADGRIVLAGDSFICGIADTESQMSFTRLLPDGQLDSSFGDGGKATITEDSGCMHAADMAMLADGRILVTVLSLSDSGAIKRLQHDGAPDLSFGPQGNHVYALPSFANEMHFRRMSVGDRFTYVSGYAHLIPTDTGGALQAGSVSFVARMDNEPIALAHSHHARPDVLPLPPIRSPHPPR